MGCGHSAASTVVHSTALLQHLETRILQVHSPSLPFITNCNTCCFGSITIFSGIWTTVINRFHYSDLFLRFPLVVRRLWYDACSLSHKCFELCISSVFVFRQISGRNSAEVCPNKLRSTNQTFISRRTAEYISLPPRGCSTHSGN